MGNTMSQADRHNITSYHREDGEVSPAAYQPKSTSMPPLRGGDVPAQTGGIARDNGWWVDLSTADAGARTGYRLGACIDNGSDSDYCEISASTFHTQRASCKPQQRGSSVAVAPACGAFDFNNSTQPLPWNDRERDDDFQVMFLQAR